MEECKYEEKKTKKNHIDKENIVIPDTDESDDDPLIEYLYTTKHKIDVSRLSQKMSFILIVYLLKKNFYCTFSKTHACIHREDVLWYHATGTIFLFNIGVL